MKRARQAVKSPLDGILLFELMENGLRVMQAVCGMLCFSTRLVVHWMESVTKMLLSMRMAAK